MKTNTEFKYINFLLLIITVLPVLLLTQAAYACSVPVFRYALERWKPDPYKGAYIYRGEISADDRALLEQLNDASVNAETPLNLIIKPVNLDTFSEEKLAELLQGRIPSELPVLALWYPNQMGKAPPFIQEKLSASLVKNISQSPKRMELAEGLIKGASVVWVFIPSGKNEKDESALNLIKQELDSSLKKYSSNPFSILAGSQRKKLTYDFPIMILERDDPAERIFIETLMKSEPDLYQHTGEPMVFPVFGRGRSLGCLFGEFITLKNIDEAAFFLSGACSCEVKNLNPGVDMLIAAPWDVVVMNTFIQDEPVPELTGVMPQSDQNETPKEEQRSFPKADVNPEGDASLFKLYGVTLAGVIIIVIIGGIMLSRRRREK